MSPHPFSRRELLRWGAVAGAAAPFARLAAEEKAAPPASAAPSYLDAAVRAARWVRSTRIETQTGYIWLTGPERSQGLESVPTLYHGSSGVILFLVELAHVTGDKAHLEEAVHGAEALAAQIPAKLGLDEAGFYTGAAGRGWALERVAAASGNEALHGAAKRCRDLIHASARKSGAGVDWGDTTDIIAGTAGTSLYLLDLARREKDDAARELAVQAGLRLRELGIPEAGGTKWKMEPTFKEVMPNFSHGTAGVAYFLTELYRATHRQEFLDAALSGARYLTAVADRGPAGDSCLIFHDEPDNKSLYYLGWCHGPAGTARFFYDLHRATGDAVWLDWARKGAKALLDSGIPEHPTPGFWNNVGQCCGSCGVGELMLGLHRVTGDERYLAFAHRLAKDILARATPTPGDGLKWIHAEHRVRPDYTYAQTGYMQGAAGIGAFLLHLDALEKKREWNLYLPDSPWGEAKGAGAST
jgi:lantibiotic modifying enzyme